jgi:hypothetical protein
VALAAVAQQRDDRVAGAQGARRLDGADAVHCRAAANEQGVRAGGRLDSVGGWIRLVGWSVVVVGGFLLGWVGLLKRALRAQTAHRSKCAAISTASLSVPLNAPSMAAREKLAVRRLRPMPSVIVSNGCLRRVPSASSFV